jgi:hypothetical protein
VSHPGLLRDPDRFAASRLPVARDKWKTIEVANRTGGFGFAPRVISAIQKWTLPRRAGSALIEAKAVTTCSTGLAATISSTRPVCEAISSIRPVCEAMRGNEAQPVTVHDGPMDASLELMTERGSHDLPPRSTT